jgi:hypothetical protein
MVEWGSMRCAPTFLLLIGTAACTHTQAPATDFVNQELSGRINGKDWTYKHAYVDPTIDTAEDEDLVVVFLSYVPKKPCPVEEEEGQDRTSVMVSAPPNKKVNPLKRGTARSLVFHFDKKGEQFAQVAKKGKIKILDNNGAKLKGKVFATLNDSTWVSGNFQAVVCDYRDMQKKPTFD